MRTDKDGNQWTLEQDIIYVWKGHGLNVIEERVVGDKWIIKAVRNEVGEVKNGS